MFLRTIENRLKIGRYVPILRHQSARIEPCGDYRVANSDELTEILYFKHFFDGFIFKKNSDGSLKKSKIDSFLVRVCVDLETMDTS